MQIFNNISYGNKHCKQNVEQYGTVKTDTLLYVRPVI